MTDSPLIELETRLAYQDEALRVLSDEVAHQQRRIEQLERRWQELTDRLSSLGDTDGQATSHDEPPPPHY